MDDKAFKQFEERRERCEKSDLKFALDLVYVLKNDLSKLHPNVIEHIARLVGR